MTVGKTRVRIPKEIAKGERIEVKTLIVHPMESGWRKNDLGELIPRLIIKKFVCHFEGEVVIDVAMDSPVSTDPYISFIFEPPSDGELVFEWHEDSGEIYRHSRNITLI